MSTQHSASIAICAIDSPLLTSSQPLDSALIILNSPIRSPPSPLFEKLWTRSKFVVCADGGANRLFDADSERWTPHLIKGDLDSLRLDVRKHYADHGCEICRDPDQDTNDLDKSLQSVQQKGYKACCIYGAFGGRFDQEMGAFQALYRWADRFDSLWLYDDQTCAVLLQPHVRNEIRIVHPDSIRDEAIPGEGPTCGLIPLNGLVESVTTTGLKWNLQDQSTSFGGLVSTSNHVVDEQVTVEASGSLIFTAEVVSGV